MSNTIILKNGTTTPGVTDLEVAEPGFKKNTGTLYIGNGDRVVQINPIISSEEPERISGALWIDTSVESSTEESPLPILQGGTGANSAIDARINLGAAPDGYGLGAQFPKSITSLADLDTLAQNGWYVISASGSTLAGVGFNHAMIFVQCRYGSIYQELVPIKSTTKLRRYKYDGTWSEWEVENPPLIAGVEYRTTERLDGRPVYKYLFNYGYYTKGTEATVIPHGLSIYQPISIEITNNLTEVLSTSAGMKELSFNRTNVNLLCDWSMGNVHFIMKYTK